LTPTLTVILCGLIEVGRALEGFVHAVADPASAGLDVIDEEGVEDI